jgi:hypothetical protein
MTPAAVRLRGDCAIRGSATAGGRERGASRTPRRADPELLVRQV